MAPNNPLPIHGNEKTMNLNHLILTNIQSSPYFKVNLYELKTYHEVIDEIFFKVSHLEPWERGSRKTAGQTGMCGGVRGVGAGGIVSSAFCLLYKLFTLKLTRKQLIGLLTHKDSPYIRGLGFMYIRYTQPPADLWDWYCDYLDDDEEIDVRAGGGHVMTIGEMVRLWMTKLEWYSTLFPRIPVPIQKSIEANLKEYDAEKQQSGFGEAAMAVAQIPPGGPTSLGPDGLLPKPSSARNSPAVDRAPHRPHTDSRHGSREASREASRKESSDTRDRHRHRSRSNERRRRSKSRERHRHRRSRSRDRGSRKHRSRSHERRRHRSRSPTHHKKRESSFERDLRREQERVRREKH